MESSKCRARAEPHLETWRVDQERAAFADMVLPAMRERAILDAGIDQILATLAAVAAIADGKPVADFMDVRNGAAVRQSRKRDEAGEEESIGAVGFHAKNLNFTGC